MRATTETEPPIAQETIAALARQIWEDEGRPAGRDLDHWVRAEQQLRANRANQANQVDQALQSNRAAGNARTPALGARRPAATGAPSKNHR